MSHKLSDAAFGRLLARTARHAELGSEIQSDLTEAFNERYGKTHSDVDCDTLIDALDYGGGSVPTVEQADEEMTRCGAPPQGLEHGSGQ